MEKIINKIYRYLIPVLVLGISFGYTQFSICLILLVLRILVANKQTMGFYLIMYGGVIGGVVRTMYPFIPTYGMGLMLLGVILSLDKLKEMFGNGNRSVTMLMVLYFVFTIFYFLGPQDEFATSKLTGIYQVGAFSLLGYYMFCTSERINSESILQIIFMSTLLMFTFVIQYYEFSRGAIYDYEWFRAQEYAYAASNHFQGGTMIAYQHIAMNMLFGFAIYLSQNVFANKWWLLAYTILAFQLIMTSGCRQAILGLFLVLILRMSFFREQAGEKNFIQKHIKSLVIMFILLIVSYQFLTSLNAEFITKTLESGDEGRMFLMMEGIRIFTENVVLGSGLGGYHAITGDVYPHNFLVEVLCECGLVGLLILVSMLLYCLRQGNASLMYKTSNGSYLYLILAALFVRVSVSGDFTESVELFSAVFATLAFANLSNKHKN